MTTSTYETGIRLAMRANAIARNKGADPARFAHLLAREQLLAAVGRVADEDTVALKGSMLVLLDPAMETYIRPHKDVDVHFGDVTHEDLSFLLRAAAANAESLGIRFEISEAKVLYHPNDREGARYDVVATMGKTVSRFQLDCAIGGERSPGMRFVETASILPGMPAMRILAYPLEAQVGDKLHAIAQHGAANTRLKDFYDLWHLSRRHDLDPDLLHACVVQGFANQGRTLPHVPVMLPGLSRTYGAANQTAWETMLRKAGRDDMAPVDFVSVVDTVRAFANRVLSPPMPRDESHFTRDSSAAPAPRMPAYA